MWLRSVAILLAAAFAAVTPRVPGHSTSAATVASHLHAPRVYVGPSHESRRTRTLTLRRLRSRTRRHAIPAQVTGQPRTTAASAIVIDGWTGAVLYDKDADAEREPASTVKIMTALVLLEHHVRLTRLVTVSADAAATEGSTAGLQAGERLTVWDLLHGMLLPSGNDAAMELAEVTAGSEPGFVALMNREARRLRLHRTRYLTPDGLPTPGQVTSARDLATVARAAMQWLVFDQIVRTRTWTAVSQGGGQTHQWTSLNQLLWTSPYVDGVKTGTTPTAGACLASSAQLDGRWVIAVNLDSALNARFSDASALLSYGLSIAVPAPSA